MHWAPLYSLTYIYMYVVHPIVLTDFSEGRKKTTYNIHHRNYTERVFIRASWRQAFEASTAGKSDAVSNPVTLAILAATIFTKSIWTTINEV